MDDASSRSTAVWVITLLTVLLVTPFVVSLMQR